MLFSLSGLQRLAVVGVVLSAPFWLPKLVGGTNQARSLHATLAGPANEPPIGFTTKDPLDPAMKTGYRHPVYEDYITPYNMMFPTSDPAFAGFNHRNFVLELDQNDRDPNYGWVSIRLPEGIVKPAGEQLRSAACRVFRAVILEPHHTGYQHLLIQMYDDSAAVRFDLHQGDCGP